MNLSTALQVGNPGYIYMCQDYHQIFNVHKASWVGGSFLFMFYSHFSLCARSSFPGSFSCVSVFLVSQAVGTWCVIMVVSVGSAGHGPQVQLTGCVV